MLTIHVVYTGVFSHVVDLYKIDTDVQIVQTRVYSGRLSLDLQIYWQLLIDQVEYR